MNSSSISCEDAFLSRYQRFTKALRYLSMYLMYLRYYYRSVCVCLDRIAGYVITMIIPN